MERNVLIVNKLGLHARAASKLVQTTSAWPCVIELRKGQKTVNAKSILGVMMLAAAKGSEITIIANGEQEAEAIDAVAALVADRFGEEQ